VLLGLPRAQRIRLHKVLPGCRLLPHVADAPTAPSACRGAAKPGVRLRSGAQRFSPVQPHSPVRGARPESWPPQPALLCRSLNLSLDTA
jgi:hypothetical protein